MGYSSTSDAAPAKRVADTRAPERRTVGRFAETRTVRAVRWAFRLSSRVAPTLTAHAAYALLAKPPRGPERVWQRALREQARSSCVRVGPHTVAVYEWGAGPTVLIVHGWGARSTHLGKMVEPLVSAGFRVVAFDAPAHGHSDGRATDPVEFAAAVTAVARHVGPVHTLLAHSFGVAMALYARRDWGVKAERMVFISSFNHCKWFLDAFAQYLGIKPSVMAQAGQMMVKRYQGRLNWDHMSVVDMLRCTREPTLIIHDSDDEEIPFQHSIDLFRAAPHAEFHATSGLGHHKLLGNGDVIERVVKFAAGSQEH